MRWCATLFLLVLSACATVHAPQAGPPSLVAAVGQPAPAQARYYADCIAQATQTQSYDRENNWLRFHCTGAPAAAFYNALADWSAAHNSQLAGEGRTWRFTERPQHDPSGLDSCWRSASDATQYGCTVVLNVGDFLSQQR